MKSFVKKNKAIQGTNFALALLIAGLVVSPKAHSQTDAAINWEDPNLTSPSLADSKDATEASMLCSNVGNSPCVNITQSALVVNEAQDLVFIAHSTADSFGSIENDSLILPAGRMPASTTSTTSSTAR